MDRPPVWSRQGGAVHGWGLAAHPPQAGMMGLLVQGGGQDVFAVWRELHEGHRRVVVICVEHRRGCRGAPHHRPAGSPPHVPTLPPPTTRASVRAAPPRDPRTGELREPRPCGQSASGGWAFSAPGPRPLRAQRRPQGAISQGGSPTPSCPEDAAAPLNRGGRSPEGYSGSVQVLPGNHLAMSRPRPRA